MKGLFQAFFGLALFRQTLILSLLLCAGLPLRAQERTAFFGGSGYASAGLGFFDFNSINTRLNAHDVPSIPQVSNSLGGGAHLMFGKFVIGGSIQEFLAKNFQFDSIKLEVRAGYGFFELGYLALARKRVQVYPVIGFGSGGYTFKAAVVDSNLTFDSLIINPKRGIELTSGGLLLNACLNFDFYLSKVQREHPYGALTGLEVGYTYMPKVKEWYVAGVPIVGSPLTNLNTFYVRVKLGIGGFKKSNRKK